MGSQCCGRLRSLAVRQQGAVAVEAALIIPLLIVLVFGIIEFGLLIRDYVAVTAATRSAARVASAEPRAAGFDTDAREAALHAMSSLPIGDLREVWVYRANADGFPGTDAGGSFANCTASIDCVRFSYAPETQTWTAVGGFDYHKVVACQGAADATSVGVYIRADHQSLTRLIFDSVGMAEHAVMRFEPMPTVNGLAGGNCRPT